MGQIFPVVSERKFGNPMLRGSLSFLCFDLWHGPLGFPFLLYPFVSVAQCKSEVSCLLFLASR